MHIQESGEMYLETIYILSKKSAHVRAIDIGEHMGYSKPSVSRALGLLKKGGYITSDDDGYIKLTDLGRDVAESMYERHTLLTDFLVSLGVPHNVAVADACKIEHDISRETFDAIKRAAIGKTEV
ncbi:MAG: metal-dependent transcriptional regulator [Eubacteriales bacterium]|jgi:DtxR family Mn-dependent transcriptional regulator|nr:metal-dependent transcriptional regulator [Clostridiales bacterium]